MNPEEKRNKIEEIYANVFKAEDALVRAQFISGTHALAITLSALLRPNDTMISITGEPYDTLQTVIGCNETESKSSLKAFGIKYEQIELVENDFDIKSIQERLKKQDVKLVEIQRSRGYSTRKSLTIEKIEKAIKAIREVNKDVIIMVDNCYGEFVQDREPIEIGADIAVGSLMKNLGAGIATSGAYIVGKKDLIELCAERLTAPGIGKEIGPSLGQNTQLLKGLFFAPQVVASSVKTAIFASRILEKLGYPERTVELTRIAGYMHDIGNCVNRVDHAHTGAIFAYNILKEMGMPIEEITEIMMAIGNHDENTGTAVSDISAALILADKSDVHRDRVVNKNLSTFDIHDRVNYAVTDADLIMNAEERKITLNLTIDTKISPVLDYFEIFMQRTMMCKYAAKYLKIWFELIINDTKLL